MPRPKTLLGKTATRKNLADAWQHISRFAWDSSHGLSDETIKEFRSNLKRNLEGIRTELLNGKYKFGKLRASTRRKKSGKPRPLQIADIRDRVVLRAIAKILEDELEDKFELDNLVSFAYLRGKGVRTAINQMLRYHQQGYNIILEADIENFFGTVKVDALLNSVIYPSLKDETLNKLIEEAFEMEIGNREDLSEEVKGLFPEDPVGLPQGGYLSPLFSNIYLSEFDQTMVKNGLLLIRYADDFIVMCKAKAEAERAHEIAKEVLEERLGLKLHKLNNKDKNAKTRILQLGKQNIRFLGIQFDGKRILPDPDKKRELSHKLAAIRSESRTVIDLLISIRNLLEGWIAAYSFTDLTESYINAIDNEVNKILWSTLGNLEWKLLPRQQLSKAQRENSGIDPVSWHLDKVRANYRREDRELLEKYWTKTSEQPAV
jgi:RNA-directed DNA polymerase